MKTTNLNSGLSLLSQSFLRLTFTCLFLTNFGLICFLINSAQAQGNNDINGDGTLNILVLGTNSSLNGTEVFSPDQIALELANIMSADPSITINTNVVAEDIHMSKSVTVGLGGGGSEFNWMHHSHSLLQYYYWPEGHDARLNNLSGNDGVDWDYVIIGADPYFVSNLPGYYSLGVNKIAAKVVEGGAQPLLLMMWPEDQSSETSIEHFEEFTYRTADGAKVPTDVIPSGLAWQALPNDKRDVSNVHPTPNGAYLSAASIYSHIYDRNASSSAYTYDDKIADIALMTVAGQNNQIHYSGVRSFISPYKSCDIGDSVINYNETGSSTENGILDGLNWVFGMSPKTLQNGGTSPINLNYGRANSNFEPNKRYQINPALFDFSFGLPMQDHGNHGNTSMLYGLDKRDSGTMNDTDVGVARFMIEQSELPYARAIPIRTLYAQIEEAIPGQSAYRDSWHMHRDLDKSIAAYMYTMLNGTCVLGAEPTNQTSDAWKTWMSQKIGHETAWTFMYMEGNAPDCSTLVDVDADGFNSFVDCDDNNININPNQSEIAFNGIDDDCNPATLDDDQDQDGFSIAEDCEDMNPNINPSAWDIPNNSIDEDCDGSDQVLESCSQYDQGPWDELETGADCTTGPISPNIQVWSNVAYSVLGLQDNQAYYFSFCTGYNPANWEALITVHEYEEATNTIGNIITSAANCSIEWSYNYESAFPDVLILVNDRNNCTGNTEETNNGSPEFGCLNCIAHREIRNTHRTFTLDASQMIDSKAIILENSSVEYHAGQEVLLLPGFETKQNVLFHAFINGCVNP